MMRLSPNLEVSVDCPACGDPMEPIDWLVPGMHNLALVKCEPCDRTFYKELPSGAGLFYPGMIDAQTGERCDDFAPNNWFLVGLEEGFASRVFKPLSFKCEEMKPLSGRPIAVLNTIDHCYGHSVYELFHSQYYLDHEDVDLIVIVQPPLRWMVPDGVAQVWTVDLPFKRAREWNDWLSKEIKERLGRYQSEVYLCRPFVQADSRDYSIERFTRIKPFPLDEWDKRLSKPTITFIWRADRIWKQFINPTIYNRFAKRLAPEMLNRFEQKYQQRWIVKLAECLRKNIPNLDFAVGGLKDNSPDFPSWIKDFRADGHTDESARRMCERYAESHLVIGCNGSNLLVPGTHSGGMINLVPETWWAVSAGTFPYRITDIGDTDYRYVLLPGEISIRALTDVVVSVLRDRAIIQLHTDKEWRDHGRNRNTAEWAKFHLHWLDIYNEFSIR